MDNIDKFTKSQYDELVKEYNDALKNNRASLYFNDSEVLIDYAKYVIEYLSPKFKNIK